MQQHAIAKDIGATFHTVFNVVIMPSSVHIHLVPSERAQASLVDV
jgi:hypothetical protein